MTNEASTSAQPNQNEHDVICHMDVAIGDAVGRADYDGRTYFFCSTGCQQRFEAGPDAALAAEDGYDHAAARSSMEALIE